MSDKKIWLITSGCYSDYGVTGVFSTLEAAEWALGPEKEDDGYGSRIEEFPLDPSIEQMHAGRFAWSVNMERDGSVLESPTKCGWSFADEPSVRVAKRSKWDWSGPGTGKMITTGPDYLEGSVWATDEQHAVKIVNERRLQMIASGEFRENGEGTAP